MLIDELVGHVKIEDPDFTIDPTDLDEIKPYLKKRFKALLAQNIWGYNEFYQIYNDENEILLKAIDIINTNEYDKMNLAHE